MAATLSRDAVRFRADVANDLTALASIRDQLGAALTVRGWDAADVFRILVCADEALANASHYGAASADIAVRFRVHTDRASIAVANRTSSAAKFPATDVVPATGEEHGRGLILLRALSDAFRSRCTSTGTILAVSFARSAR